MDIFIESHLIIVSNACITGDIVRTGATKLLYTNKNKTANFFMGWNFRSLFHFAKISLLNHPVCENRKATTLQLFISHISMHNLDRLLESSQNARLRKKQQWYI